MGVVVKLNQNESIDLKEAMKIVKAKWNAKNISKSDLKNEEPNIAEEKKSPDHLEAHIIALINGGIS